MYSDYRMSCFSSELARVKYSSLANAKVACMKAGHTCGAVTNNDNVWEVHVCKKHGLYTRFSLGTYPKKKSMFLCPGVL